MKNFTILTGSILLLLSPLFGEALENPVYFDDAQEKQTLQAKEIDDVMDRAWKAIKEGNNEKAIELLSEAILLLKSESEFKITKLILCSEISDYRDFTPKDSNVLEAGEPLLLYIEPDGYRLLKKENEYEIWVSLDASITDSKGEVIFERNNWVDYKKLFPTPIIPFYLTNRVSDIPPGQYTYTVTLKDHHKNAFLSKSFEFKVE